jgi:hypothetical protein
MMKIGAEDQELGQSIGLFNCFLVAGGVCVGQDPQSCGILDGAFTGVFLAVLERLVSLEVQLVKFLISNSRHTV